MKLQDNLIVMAYCNATGIVEEIIYHKSREGLHLQPGESIFQNLPFENNNGVRLKGIVSKKDSVFGFVLQTSTEGLEKQMVLHGFPMKQGYLIMVEEDFYCGEDCQDSYGEIMKLNSELTNARREVAKKNQELKGMNEKLESLARKDPLTDLFNRYDLQEKFEEALKRSRRMEIKYSIAMVDFNNFKKVNDELGHAAGDQLLKDFAGLAVKETRTGFDYVFRIGGDEFLFLFEDCGKEKAEEVIHRIEKKLKKYTSVASLAFGVLEVPIEEEPKLDKLLKQADEKMYQDKRKKHKKNE